MPPRITVRSPASLDIHLRRWGDGEHACFLVHGSGEHCRVWDHFASHLPRRYKAYAMDLRGHGDSDWDRQCRYRTVDHAHDLTAAIDELAGGPAVLVGHSLGADVVLHVAALHPERVRAIALIDPGVGRSDLTRNHVRDTILSTPREYDSVRSYVEIIRQQRPLADPLLLTAVAQHSLRAREDGTFHLKFDPAIATVPADIDEASWWSAVGRVRCPMLVVRGAGSAVLSSQAAQRIVRSTVHCTLSVVPMAGHGVMIDNPAEFSTHVLNFLECADRS